MGGKTATDYAREGYTDPELRAALKEEIKASDKGGRPGEWSARKSQLLAAEYKRRGGGFRGRRNQEQAASLERWTEEEWQTRSGDTRARHGDTTERYLPKEAWESLSPEERERTARRKRRGSRRGHQRVPNPPAARKAAARADLAHMTREQLYAEARKRQVPGRSKLDRRGLVEALLEEGRA